MANSEVRQKIDQSRLCLRTSSAASPIRCQYPAFPKFEPSSAFRTGYFFRELCRVFLRNRYTRSRQLKTADLELPRLDRANHSGGSPFRAVCIHNCGALLPRKQCKSSGSTTKLFLLTTLRPKLLVFKRLRDPHRGLTRLKSRT